MTRRTLLRMVFVLAAGAAILFGVLRWSLSDHEVSRVPLPGSDLVLVLTEDLKKLYSYQVFEHDRPVSAPRLLGPRHSVPCPSPRLTVAGPAVRIDWGDATSNHYVRLDTERRVILDDSNQAGTPPLIQPQE